jgi:hypothetical protein
MGTRQLYWILTDASLIVRALGKSAIFCLWSFHGTKIVRKSSHLYGELSPLANITSANTATLTTSLPFSWSFSSLRGAGKGSA